MRKVLEACPTCGGPLTITEVRCERCATEVRARYQPCPFCRLTSEQMSFVLLFLQCRGNLTDVEKALGVSYPTIRAKLDEVIRMVAPGSAAPTPPARPAVESGEPQREILARIAGGTLSVAEGLAALRAARGAPGAGTHPGQ